MGIHMRNSVINSELETEVRTLLLLSSARKKALTLERIVALDFIVCYAGSFQFPYLNPQGDNRYMFAELGSRRERIRAAIKDLVLRGLVDVHFDSGYCFSISDRGSAFIRKLKSEYAIQYKKIAQDAISRYKAYSDADLDRIIHNSAVSSIGGSR